MVGHSFPPPIGGGLIEAIRVAETGHYLVDFRPRSGAASLKPVTPNSRLRLVAAFPPPIGGGLIEAVPELTELNIHRLFPPPIGGGLIEAPLPTCGIRTWHRISAPDRGRPH